MTRSFLLCGVGGQGTVLASKLIAAAAMANGQNARTAETIGMAQRGGCVVSHVRIGGTIHSPLIPIGGADGIIGFEPGEAVRCLPYLKEGGVVVVSQKAIQPITSTLSNSAYDGAKMLSYLKENVSNLIIVDGDEICRKCGSNKVLNVALLGAAAASNMLKITLEEIENAIIDRVPEKFHAVNQKALHLGAQTAEIKNV